MNVLQVSTYDHVGGAARVAYSLHAEYTARGLGSTMLVRRAVTRDGGVRIINGSGVLHVMEDRFEQVEEALGVQALLYPSSFMLPFRSAFRSASVVHLHNLHGGYFSVVSLPVVARRKPLMWTLHDMWAITGHCSHAFDCERWLTGCGKCPSLATPPAMRRDGTRLMIALKKKILSHTDLVLVTPSMWLKGLVERSPVTAKLQCVYVPNAVDPTVFRPEDRTDLRRIHGLRADRPVIALTAPLANANYKGPAMLSEFLEELVQHEKRVQIVVLGEKGSLEPFRSGFDIHEFGWVEDVRLLSQLLAMSDLYLMTSTAENAPLSVLEAMACGTPVVAFDVGGIREQVDPPQAGLLAPAGLVGGLIEAALAILDDSELRSKMGVNAREIVLREYSIVKQADRYIALYESIASDRNMTRK